MLLIHLNIIFKGENFANFAVLSQTMKISASKYLSKHALSLRKNALSLQKFISKQGNLTQQQNFFIFETFRLHDTPQLLSNKASLYQ